MEDIILILCFIGLAVTGHYKILILMLIIFIGFPVLILKIYPNTKEYTIKSIIVILSIISSLFIFRQYQILKWLAIIFVGIPATFGVAGLIGGSIGYFFQKKNQKSKETEEES